MGRTEIKKREPLKRPSEDKKLSRLDLLRRKLEIERDMLEKGKQSEAKELKKIKIELEARQEEQEETEAKQEPLEGQEIIKKVADIIKTSKERESQITPSLPAMKNFLKRIEAYKKIFMQVRNEIAKIVIGQEDAVKGMLRALIADGHVLLEGVPGIAKTTLIRTLAQTINCSFARIQFTPDLLPTDIIGISTYQEGRGFYTLKGPIFNNFILADEINRAPPKVQSALLECMAEKQATIAKESFPVPLPFFAMATQNPLESVGTYALPEAQIDRFLFKLYMGYPAMDDEQKILRTNISAKSFDSYAVKHILDPESLIRVQKEANQIFVDKKVEKYIIRIVDATRFPKKYGITLGKYVEFGASPRGSIGIFRAAKAEALLNGQSYITPHNVKTVTHDVLRHRLLLSYEGQAEGIKTEQVITEILKKVPVP